MPLDARVVDLSCLDHLSGSSRSFLFSADAVSPLTEGQDEALTQAISTFSYWQSACQMAGADLLALRGPDRFSIASRRGGVIVEAEKPLNIGLLRAGLKSHQAVEATWHAPVNTDAFDPVNRVIWALTHRLGRVETPRSFEMLAGEAEYVLRADKSGFGIMDQEGGVARLRTKIREAVGTGLQVEFTFGSLRDAPPTSHHSAVSLVVQEESDGAIHFSESGWPEALPTELSVDELQSLMAITQMAVRDRLNSVELRDQHGQPLLQMSVDAASRSITGTINRRE